MAAINDLLQQITDPALRGRLEQEVARLSKNKKFGLVFEEHIPECTPLYGVAIKRGSIVARKAGKINDTFTVVNLTGDTALCRHKATGEMKEFEISELVSVAQFGEPIFPALEPIDSVENAPDSSLWHTLIEADNYHALQLLEYLYPKQVDCIYIDPPYNTGARDWKYNNDYVDSSDSWRHSKWLSMMQKRLVLAKRLLNPITGVLIVTIDEHEFHHLRTLLAEIFPETFIQSVTIVVNPKGVSQGRFSRVEEYAIFVFMKDAMLSKWDDPMLGENAVTKKVRWAVLLRSGNNSQRENRKKMFYPILIDTESHRVVKALDALPYQEHPVLLEKIEGYDVAWPIRTDMSEGNWSVSNTTLNSLIDLGYVALGSFDSRRKTWAITYLNKKSRTQIESGEILITDTNPVTKVVMAEFAGVKSHEVRSVWNRALHNAGTYGSDILTSVIGKSKTFSFPKSIYAEHDTLAMAVKDNPDALIVDFFAGSGTTLHAVNLLNAEDGGQRRCILVTNNEVADSEVKQLSKIGIQSGDIEWEEHGICRSVTWPRTKYSILGRRADGSTLTGEYFTNQTVTKEESRTFYQLGFAENPVELTHQMKKQIVAILRSKDGKAQLPQSLVKPDSKFIVSEKHTASILFDINAVDTWLDALEDQDRITDIYILAKETAAFNEIKALVSELLGPITVTSQLKRPMSDGLPANVEYFKLGFLDKNSVSLGRQFREILPLLWLKSGSVGRRPEVTKDVEPDMLILPKNRFAILVDETKYAEFSRKISSEDTLDTIYFVTNSEDAFRAMSADIKIKNTYQLYRDYIDNFVLGSRRES